MVRIPLGTHDLVTRPARADEIGRIVHVERQEGIRNGTDYRGLASIACSFLPKICSWLTDDAKLFRVE